MTRLRNWLCHACTGWRLSWPTVAPCLVCHRERAIGERGVCRLCWRQASNAREATKRERPYRPLDIIAANRYGQQLSFADMGRR